MNLSSFRKADEVMTIPYSVTASEYYTYNFYGYQKHGRKKAVYVCYFHMVSSTY